MSWRRQNWTCPTADRSGERRRAADEALEPARAQMTTLIEETTRRLGAGDAAIFKAQARCSTTRCDLDHPHLPVDGRGHGVAWSWHQAIERMAGQLSALGNPVLAARSADLRDIGRRVLAQIDPGLGRARWTAVHPGRGRSGNRRTPPRLSPAASRASPPRWAAPPRTAPSSPVRSACRRWSRAARALVAKAAGSIAIVDGDTGRVWLDPSEADLASRGAGSPRSRRGARGGGGRTQPPRGNARRPSGRDRRQCEPARSRWPSAGPGWRGRRPDAHRIPVPRTRRQPSEDEQFAIYRAMIEALGAAR
jgi:phosphocarrier protein FPr